MSIFAPTTHRKLAEQQLKDAQFKLLAHKAAAEEHTNYATMLEGRIERLQAYLQPVQPKETK